MSFEAQMRVGTLEMSVALMLVAAVAARPRVRAVSEVGPLQPMRVGLEFREAGSVRRFEGRPPFEAGRGRDLELALHDPEISRRHARFESRNGAVYLSDLESSNGTFLNGRRVRAPIEVREGDEIDLGTTRLFVTTVAPWT